MMQRLFNNLKAILWLLTQKVEFKKTQNGEFELWYERSSIRFYKGGHISILSAGNLMWNCLPSEIEVHFGESEIPLEEDYIAS